MKRQYIVAYGLSGFPIQDKITCAIEVDFKDETNTVRKMIIILQEIVRVHNSAEDITYKYGKIIASAIGITLLTDIT